MSIPKIIKVEENIVYWESVINADEYIINVNEIFESSTNNNYYNLDELKINEGNITIKVRALSDNTSFIDSNWSETFDFEYKKESGSNDSDEDDYDDFELYLLGTGVNAITGSYLNFDGNTFKTNEFFDIKKLAKLYDLKTIDALDTKLKTNDGDTIKEFMEKVSTNYTHTGKEDLGLSVDGIGFCRTFSNKFSFSSDFMFKENTYQYYNLSYQTIADKRKSIKNFNPDESKNLNIISNYSVDLLNKMLSLNENDLDIAINNFLI